ncbi:hypothetical protein LBMAG42_14350 [Deltaproteobacteria bacterium]|nr:hypothetical protein LBMAG42_14350 [Deltaproteobacteria bacterium]
MRSSGSIFVLILILLPAVARAGQPLAVWLKETGPRSPSNTATGGAASEAPTPAAQPDFGLLPGQALHAVLRTSLGAVDCTLAHQTAPYSVKVFVDLARGALPWTDPRTGQLTTNPLYDGTIFHRVIPGFLVQGGDPTGTGTGGPGFSVPDEIGVDAQFDRAGLMGFANRGPNTNGSQFFVTDGPAHHLDGRYTRLGTCGNADVIEKIARVPRGERDRPVVAVVLRSVVIVAK